MKNQNIDHNKGGLVGQAARLEFTQHSPVLPGIPQAKKFGQPYVPKVPKRV